MPLRTARSDDPETHRLVPFFQSPERVRPLIQAFPLLTHGSVEGQYAT